MDGFEWTYACRLPVDLASGVSSAIMSHLFVRRERPVPLQDLFLASKFQLSTRIRGKQRVFMFACLLEEPRQNQKHSLTFVCCCLVHLPRRRRAACCGDGRDAGGEGPSRRALPVILVIKNSLREGLVGRSSSLLTCCCCRFWCCCLIICWFPRRVLALKHRSSEGYLALSANPSGHCRC